MLLYYLHLLWLYHLLLITVDGFRIFFIYKLMGWEWLWIFFHYLTYHFYWLIKLLLWLNEIVLLGNWNMHNWLLLLNLLWYVFWLFKSLNKSKSFLFFNIVDNLQFILLLLMDHWLLLRLIIHVILKLTKFVLTNLLLLFQSFLLLFDSSLYRCSLSFWGILCCVISCSYRPTFISMNSRSIIYCKLLVLSTLL